MRKLGTLFFLVIVTALVWNCGKKPAENAQALWEQAEMNFNAGEYQKSLAIYAQIAQYFPKDSLAVPALFTMADIYKNNLNDVNKAVKIYHKILRKYHRDSRAPNALFMIGYTYANDTKDLKKAEKYYRLFIKKYPEHVLRPSAEWELKYLGKSLEEIPELQTLSKEQ